MQLIVEQDIKKRIDKYLVEHTEFTRSFIAKMIDDAAITVNGKETKSSYQVKEKDCIEIDENYQEEIDIVPTQMELNIVYEDDDLLVVDKPSGMVVHPGNGNIDNTLVNGLMFYTKELSDINGDERPGIVHRIDKDTSGLLLVAKNNKTHAILAERFKKKEIKREYIALLHGVFPHNTATIDAPIGRDKIDRKKMTVTAENSKEAVTHLKVLRRYKEYTLVSLLLDTGRTHQIRVHMKYIGYPVYNDPVYSNKQATAFGQFLHSARMDFFHPNTKQPLHFESPLPKEFQEFIDSLEQDQEQ